MASDNVIIGRDRIAEFLPQKEPFIMIDELVMTDSTTTITAFEIREDNIFCHNGVFLESGIIENIAQTAAVRAGYMAKTKNMKTPLGYIGAVKDLIIHFLPGQNMKIRTEIVLENRILDVALISGRVFCSNKTAAECNMKIFEKKE
ncbi:MAG: 3-hydroxyacyl-ACP dehydratase [Bacteroidetes bacterium]|nr:3-hydroxyacyl-ACP dehydratase [Bacteroidota bacterium]